MAVEFTLDKVDFVALNPESVRGSSTSPKQSRRRIHWAVRLAQRQIRSLVPTGTGVIDPTDFDIRGKHYQLELRHSDKLGKLQDNELVIWQVKPPS